MLTTAQNPNPENKPFSELSPIAKAIIKAKKKKELFDRFKSKKEG